MFIHVTLTRAESHFTLLHESFLEKDIHAWRHHLPSSIPAVVGGRGGGEKFLMAGRKTRKAYCGKLGG
jgi:hypothetical protein